MQGKSTILRPRIAIRALLFLLISGSGAESKDIGILVDRSLSVYGKNREEAVELVCGLLTGSVNPDLREKWQVEADPSASERSDGTPTLELENLKKLMAGDGGQAIAPDTPFRLLLGDFGNLDRIGQADSMKLTENATRAGLTDKITQWAGTVGSKDQETHYRLARATTAGKLGKDQFFFLISDEIEDLVNMPVSYYLDAKALENDQELLAGRFRHADRISHLNGMNRMIQNGQSPPRRPGKADKPGYRPEHVAAIKTFKNDFAEEPIARITLRGPAIVEFFSKAGTETRNKVPVSIQVYSESARKPAYKHLETRFTSHSDTTKDKATGVNADTGLSWETTAEGLTDENYSATIQAFLVEFSADGPGVVASKATASEKVEGNGSRKFFDLFPHLEDGTYKIRLQVSHQDAGKPAEDAEFFKILKAAPAPNFKFTDYKLENTEKPGKRYLFEQGDSIINYPVEWKWEPSNEQPVGNPARFERELNYYPEGPGGQVVRLPDSQEGFLTDQPGRRSARLGDLFTGGKTGRAPINGGDYELILRAYWTNENGDTTTAQTTAWFTLPYPILRILRPADLEGESGDSPPGTGKGDAEDSPLIVRKGDVIKISNWMHGWKGFDYKLWIGEKSHGASELSKRDSALPIALVEREDGQHYLIVGDRFEGTVRYMVVFGPGDDTEVAWPSDTGYIRYEPRSWLPWIMLAVALLFIALLVKGVLQSRRARARR